MHQNYVIVKPISSREILYFTKDGKFREINENEFHLVKEFREFHDGTETIKTLPPGIYFCQRAFVVTKSETVEKNSETEYELLLQVEAELKEADKLPFSERVEAKRAILDFVEIKRKK